MPLLFFDDTVLQGNARDSRIDHALKCLDRKCGTNKSVRSLFERDRTLDTTRLVRLLSANAGNKKGRLIEEARQDAGLTDLFHRAVQSYLMQKTRNVPNDRTYGIVQDAMKASAREMARELPVLYHPALMSSRPLHGLFMNGARSTAPPLAHTLLHMAHVFIDEPVVFDGIKPCLMALKEVHDALGRSSDAELRAALARCSSDVRRTFSRDDGGSEVMQALHRLYADQRDQTIGVELRRSAKNMHDLDAYLVHQLLAIREQLFKLDEMSRSKRIDRDEIAAILG